MAATIDQFYNSASQISSRRTSAIRQALSVSAPGYSELSEAAKRLIPQAPDPGLKNALGQWAASRDERSLVHARRGTSGKILASGVVLTPHDLKGVGHTGGLVDEISLAEIRANAELEQGLPYYNATQGQKDPIPGLRPTSGENIPRSLSEVRANELRATYGENIPIMHRYAYGATVEKGQTAFSAFGYDTETRLEGEKIILRREVADRTRITSGDYLGHKNPTIPLSQISEGAQASVLVGTDAEHISAQASRSGLEHIKSANDFIPGRGSVNNFRQFETMTLGVGMHDIEAMIVQPQHIGVESLSDPLRRISGMNQNYGRALDIGTMMHQSGERMKAARYGIDYVQDNRGFNVEMHNPAMTETFIGGPGSRLPVPVTMDELPKGATPFEAYLHSTKKAIDSGVESSKIPGLDAMIEGDRQFVSKEIGSHLEEYGRAKGIGFTGTIDDVLKTNSGRLPMQGLAVGSSAEMKTIAGAPRRMPIQRATAATQAKIAGSIVMETIEDNVEKVVQRSGATSRLLGAATEASSYVAGGAAKSGLLRQAAAAATILKTIT
jgi:hypothetical protein